MRPPSLGASRARGARPQGWHLAGGAKGVVVRPTLLSMRQLTDQRLPKADMVPVQDEPSQGRLSGNIASQFLSIRRQVVQEQFSRQLQRSTNMKLRLLAAIGGDTCLGGSCPAVYEDETGQLVIQGTILTSTQRASLRLPNGEDAVLIPSELLNAAVQRLETLR